MSDTNPFKKPESPQHGHLINITREAMQGWIQRIPKPYHVEGLQGDIELKPDDLFRLPQILTTLIRNNADQVDEMMKKPETDDDEY